MSRDTPTDRGADVVTVPDFRGPARGLFEARTLLFLGSWLENAGSARQWPLHLACIGEPPPRVVAAAERCGARISVHAPAGDGSVPVRNKLRGFEVKPETHRLLLLDADVVVLGDPGAAPDPGPGLAVARAANHRVRLDAWRRVYAALGEPMTEERMLCQRAQLADRIPLLALHGEHHLEPMHPYYNTGVLWVPWLRVPELRDAWDEYLDRLAARLPPGEPGNRTLSGCDQVGFALAVQRLRGRGLEVRELPHALHANWILLMAGEVQLSAVALYHAVHLLRLGSQTAVPDWLGEVDHYEDFILGHAYPPSAAGRVRRLAALVRGEPAPLRDLRTLCERIRELTRTHVLPSPA